MSQLSNRARRWCHSSGGQFPAQRPGFDPRSCEICGGQNGTGAGFLRVLRFPLPILIPPNSVYSSIIRGWYNRPISGRRTKWTPPHGKKNSSSNGYFISSYYCKENCNMTIARDLTEEVVLGPFLLSARHYFLASDWYILVK
jgi:hypothetical protein